MEKISGIVRGNARVTTADNKNAAPARTGMPTFGRPVGESTPIQTKSTSTASRAVALHNGMAEAKKAISAERVVSQIADDFFMSRARTAETVPALNAAPIASAAAAGPAIAVETARTGELVMADEESIEVPTGYTPRGSFVDVRA